MMVRLATLHVARCDTGIARLDRRRAVAGTFGNSTKNTIRGIATAARHSSRVARRDAIS
jgi:hypothetical protein